MQIHLIKDKDVIVIVVIIIIITVMMRISMTSYAATSWFWIQDEA